MQIALVQCKIEVILRRLNHLDTNMSHIKHFIFLVSLWAVLLLSACHSGHSDPATGGRDSVYTAEYIEKISFEEPEKALALLDTAEEKRLFTPFETNMLRCLVNHNGFSRYRTALFYARKAYADPEARKHPDKLLSLLSYMAEDSHTNGDYAASVRYCTEGLELAKKQGSKTYEADFHVTWAKTLMLMAQHGEAFRHFDIGISLLEEEARKNTSYHAWDELFYSVGLKLSALYEIDRNEEAYAMFPQMEEALKGLEASKDAPDGLAELRQAELLALICPVAYATGRKEEGDRMYRLLEANPVASTPDGEYIRIPGLVAAGRFDEALRYVYREKKLLQENTDTVNWDYINPHLQAELEAWQGKGNVREVARVQAAMLALTDTLRQRERTEDALEWSEVYESEEKDARIKEEQQKSRTAWMIAGSIGVLLIISGENDTLTASLNEMTGFRKAFFRKQEEVIALQEQVRLLASRLPMGEKTETGTETSDSGTEPKPVADTKPEQDNAANDRRLFDRIQYEIEKRELFLLKDFDKEAFAKEMNISTRKLGRLFTVFAKKPLSDYLHDLRLSYALTLLHDHPNWTIDAVAEKCGLSLRTFHRLFTKKFSITPQAYRENDQKTENLSISDNQ